jgi:hypothetical protein
MKKPPLSDKQFILSTDHPLGFRDYFLCEAILRNGRYEVKIYEGKSAINTDDWLDYLKTECRIDFSNRKVTAYCRKGVHFRQWWETMVSQGKAGAEMLLAS